MNLLQHFFRISMCVWVCVCCMCRMGHSELPLMSLDLDGSQSASVSRVAVLNSLL